jgi:hypothetical protein
LSPDTGSFKPPAWIGEFAAELLAEGELPDEMAALVPDEIVQQILTVGVKLYMAKLEAGAELDPFIGQVMTDSDVTAIVEQMLEAVSLELFELGMWQALGKL